MIKHIGNNSFEIDLPTWTDERRISIIAGQEPIAFRERVVAKDKTVTYKWLVKTDRCNLCGKCCMNLREDHIWGVDENGTCIRLVEGSPGEYYCDPNKGGMPWDCLRGDHRDKDYCTVDYEEI